MSAYSHKQTLADICLYARAIPLGSSETKAYGTLGDPIGLNSIAWTFALWLAWGCRPALRPKPGSAPGHLDTVLGFAGRDHSDPGAAAAR